RYNGGGTKLKEWRLIRLTKPNRLRAECIGIYADGWTGAYDSTYFRFKAPRRGWLRIRLARDPWPASPVHVQLASIRSQHHEPGAGPRTLEAAQPDRERPGQGTRLGHEERAHVEPVEACRLQVWPDVGEPELPGVEVEHELHLGVAGDALEQRSQVPRVVDRTEYCRRLHGFRWLVVVQVCEHELAAASQSGRDHLFAGVDADVTLLR